MATFSSASVGDGTSSSANYTRVQAYTQTPGLKDARLASVASVTDSCTAGNCSPGTSSYVMKALSGARADSCVVSTTDRRYLGGYQHKTGWWDTWNAALSDAGVIEYTAHNEGALSSDGNNAQLSRQYTYTYNNGLQSIQTESRPSAVMPGQFATTKYYRNATTNRLEKVDVTGYVRPFQRGATLLTRRTTYQYDALGRLTRMAGPCESTFEPCPATSPSTEYDYYPDAGTYSSGRLFHQRRKYNGGTSELVTTYEDYTAMGEPQKVTDENGIPTLFGYRGHQVSSRKVDFTNDAGVKPEWKYTWDTGMLAAVWVVTEIRAYLFEGRAVGVQSIAVVGLDHRDLSLKPRVRALSVEVGAGEETEKLWVACGELRHEEA